MKAHISPGNTLHEIAATSPRHSHTIRALSFSSKKIRSHRHPGLSVIVPIFNERHSLPSLIKRLTRTLDREPYDYELIFVDDHSQDGTMEYLQMMQREIPMHVLEKTGNPGKSFSLLEGFKQAEGDAICMIDADLQYPPEAIPAMVRLMNSHDIVVANRSRRKTSWLRSTMSRVYSFLFGRVLLNLNVDVQSGLKVFRKDILKHITFKTSAWGFDYQFLYKAQRLGYSIGQSNIIFEERRHGASHVPVIRTAMELAFGSVKLRLSYLVKDLLRFLDYPHRSEIKAKGFENDVDYLYLPEIHSIKHHVYRETTILLLVSAAAVASIVWTLSMLFNASPLIIISGIISSMYIILMTFKLFVVYHSIKRKPISFTKQQIAAVTDEELPIYTILIPLYKEAEVIPQIIKAMTAIDYPPEKLDIIITLEEYDHETIKAIEKAKPPAYFKTLILPDVKPKTKPKALNVAFPHTKGEFLVIYDAEIMPDADQLKKSYLAFRQHPELSCLQTRLDHYNLNDNWITKLFNAEFSFYYDLFMPGLQKLGYALPLSGHSTHFRRYVLEDIRNWDPYNVAEDCDVGIRLFRCGYRTDILDSVSLEEATMTMGSWINQRSRWMKGFIQTSIVHLRHPIRLKNDLGGWENFLGFLIIVPGSVMMNIINLFYWVLLALWFGTHSALIQAFFPGFILYISLFSFLAGNFIFTYLNLFGSYKRRRFSLVKYSLLSFVYWFMLAFATVRAAVHLLIKPHHWEKTAHGKHLLRNSYVPIAA